MIDELLISRSHNARMAAVCLSIAVGKYSDPAVLEAVARRLVSDGELKG